MANPLKDDQARAIVWLNNAVRFIYLSPHLDDAVISAGGLIRADTSAGYRAEIWSFMAGVPRDPDVPEFAQLLHRVWGFSTAAEAVQARRLEDIDAASQVGASALHFDFLDCIYRRGKEGEALYSDITLPIQAADADLPTQIARTISDRLLPDDRVVCQLGIGRHVDHVIVRQAAELLHRPLIYIADMPYVLNHPQELPPIVTGLRESLEPVSPPDFECWLRAIEAYQSQVDSVFGSHEDLRERMRAFYDERHGVRTWIVPGTSY